MHTECIHGQKEIDYKSIEAAVKKAGAMMKEARLSKESIHQKEGAANFVTNFDIAIQKFLIGELLKILPEAFVFGEEETEGNARGQEIDGYCFYIDPIDGTTNFMFGYNHSCVSVGLAYQKEIIAGFVYNPYVEEMFTGFRGKGSYLNGRRLELSDVPLKDGVAAFGCARYQEGDTDNIFAIAKEMYLRSLSIRDGGSAALDLCRVAAGSNVVYLELMLQPYDYAAASVIIEEAGGVIAQVDGAPITLDAPCPILAGTAAASAEVREIAEKICCGCLD